MIHLVTPFFLAFIVLFIILLYKKRPSVWDGHDKSYPRPRILNMVLFSHGDSYDEMYNLSRQYYRSFDNVRTVYYTFSGDVNDTSKPYVESDILYLPGEETYMPGILSKTLKTFSYFYDTQYDYYVRTNISTIVNFNLLSKALQYHKIEYGGGRNFYIYQGYRDSGCGVTDDTHVGLSYAAGTCIVLSRDMFRKVVENQSRLDMNVIDDVAIGKMIKDAFNVESFDLNVNYKHYKETYESYDEMVEYIPYTICYRNRSNDRKTDVINMRAIVGMLMSSNSNE